MPDPSLSQGAMSAEDERELWRDTYEFLELAEFVSGDRCSRCGGAVDSWTEWVPCCGPGYTCEDALYCFACHSCKVMGDEF